MRHFGLVLLLLLAGALQAVTFTANPNVAIPDNNAFGTGSTINVPATADRIYSLRAGVRIDHTYTGDLNIWLLPPGVTWAGPYAEVNNGPVVTPPFGAIELSTKNGGSANNYGTGTGGSIVYANFKSSTDPITPATAAVTGAAAPFTAQTRYIPEGLAAWNLLFAGNPSGNWTLIVADGWGVDTGTLISWQLEYLPVASGNLSIGRGAFNEPGLTLRPGTTNQVAGHVDFSAGSNISLTSVTLQAENGVLLNGSFSRVALHADTNGNGFLDTGENAVFMGTVAASANITLTAAPAVAIASGTTASYLVVVDSVASPAAAGVAFRIVAASNVNSTGTEFGSFPLNFGYHHFGPVHSFGRAPLIGLPVQDNYGPGVTDTITVPATDDRIGSLRVGIRIDHTSLQDVDVYLLPPGVTWAGPYNAGSPPTGVVTLTQDEGTNGDNYGSGAASGPYVYTYFSSNTDPTVPGTTLITAGGQNAPFTSVAVYRPIGEAAWNALYGTDPSGAWTLVVADDNNNTAGTLISWYLEYRARQRGVVSGNTAFGSSLVGQVAAGSPQPFSVTNPGEFPLSVASVVISGTHASNFVLSGLPAFPATVTPGGSLNFSISFTPSAMGARTASLDVTTNHNGVANTLNAQTLSGAGLAGVIATATPVGYGSSNVGIATAAVAHTINNTGDAPLTVSGASFTGGNAADWAFFPAPTFPMIIPVSGSAQIFARFTPGATGARTTSLRIVSNTLGVPLTPTDVTLNGTGTAGLLNTATPIAYGSTNVGTQTAVVAHTLTNNGDGALTISAASFFGGNSGDWVFSPAPTLPMVIPVSGSAQIFARFQPTATGSRATALRLAHNSGGVISNFDVTLNGTGTAGAVAAASPINYGSTNLNTPSAVVIHTITNIGTGPLTVTAAGFAGAHAGDWSVTSAPVFPAVVPVSASIQVQARFTPAVAGNRTAVLRLISNAGGTPGSQSDITVNGFATVPTLSTPAAVSYGSINVNLTTAPQTHTFQNAGNGQLTITNIQLVGGDALRWSFTSAPVLPMVIAPSGSNAVQARMSPLLVGPLSTTLRITSNSGGASGNFDVTLTGTGTSGVLSTAMSVGYGNTNVGIPSAVVNHTISNTGTGPLTVTAASFIGAQSADWAITSAPAFPAVITPSNSIQVQARFTPSAAGPRAATLQITSDTGGVASAPTNVAVSGNGTVPQLSTPTSVNYGSININQTTGAVTHTFQNTGTGPLTITNIQFVGGDAGRWSFVTAPTLPMVIAPSGSNAVQARMSPLAVGPLGTTLRVTSDSGSTVGNFDITLSGTGTSGVVDTLLVVGYPSSNVGVQSAVVTHTVTNTGTGPLTLTAASFIGPNAADWTITSAPIYPVLIPVSGNVQIQARFTPSAAGARSATLRLTSDHNGMVGSFTNISVSGIGTVPVLNTATPVSYGSININQTTAPVTHTFQNTGNGPLTITNIQFVGGDASRWSFVAAPALPMVIPPSGSNNTVQARMSPLAVGPLTTMLRITSNSGGTAGNIDVTLNGNGTSGVFASPSPISYGNSNVGVQSAVVSHTITNNGTGPLTVAGAAFVGAQAGDWSITSSPLPAVLPPSGTVQVQARFTPSVAGARAAVLQITSDTGGVASTPSNVDVTGLGTVPVLDTAGAVPYGSININQTTASVIHTFQNTGNGPLTITDLQFIGGDAARWSFVGTPSLPMVIAPSASNFVQAQMSPLTPGPLATTLRITSNSGGASGDIFVNLTGIGTVGTLSTPPSADYGSGFSGVPSSNSVYSHVIQNTGTGPLTITGAAFLGAQAAFWSFSPAPSFNIVIPAGLSASINASLTPISAGPQAATLRIFSDHGGSAGFSDVTLIGFCYSDCSVSGVIAGTDDGGPVTVSAMVNTTGTQPIDVTVTYTGGLAAGAPFLVDAESGTIQNNTILGIAPNTLLRFRWDAYATERHHSASNYVLKLTPFLGSAQGQPGSSGPVSLQRSAAWVQHELPFSTATPVMAHSAIFDAANDRMIVFGGRRGSAYNNDVWEYRRATGGDLGWRRLSPAGTLPAPRQGAGAVYDAANQRMIVFGGSNGGGSRDDLWALSLGLGTETWSQLGVGLTTRPAPRASMGMVLSTDGPDRVIIHGGLGSSILRDVWALDISVPGLESWGSSPLENGTGPERFGHCCVLDGAYAGGRLVVYGGQGTGGISSQTLQFSLSTLGWSPVATTGSPGSRLNGTCLHDAAANRLVVSGGYTGAIYTGSVFVLPLEGASAHQWTQLAPDPKAQMTRTSGAAVVDAARGHGIFFAGFNSNTEIATLSFMDLAASPAWQTPALSTSVEARRGATIVFDSGADRAVLFGGQDATALYADVWTLDRSVSSAQWQRMTISGNAPSPRAFHAAVYDPVHQRMIVMGGLDAARTSLADLWTLDLASASPTWTLHTGTVRGRWRHAMAYDSTLDRLIIHGGIWNDVIQHEVHQYDFATSAWASVPHIGVYPGFRLGHGAMFDTAGNRFIIYAGSTSSAGLNDVWAMNMGSPGVWFNMTPASGPVPAGRGHFGNAVNAAGTSAWVFGGAATFLEVAMGDMWRLDIGATDATWTQIAVTGGPPARLYHASCFDGSHYVVASGMANAGSGNVYVGDTWTLDTGNTAAGFSPADIGTTPGSMAGAAVAFDALNRRLIAFGGTNPVVLVNTTWAMDLAAPVASWQRIQSQGPSPRLRASMVYDSAGTRMVLFGGRMGSNDASATDEVWALNVGAGPHAWTQLVTTGTGPGPRSGHCAIVDGSGRMVVFGGALQNGANTNTVFVLNLATLHWTQLTPTGMASPRWGAAAVYDAAADRMIVYGGFHGGPIQLLDSLSLGGSPSWTNMARLGSAPGPLFGHSLVHDPVGGRLLLFGGQNSVGAQDALYGMNLTTGVWSIMPPVAAKPQHRAMHGAVWDAPGERMAVAGGVSDGNLPCVSRSGTADAWFWGE